MAHLNLNKYFVVALASFLLASCAGVENRAVPKLSEQEKAAFETTRTPYTSEFLYSDALEALGRYVNDYAETVVKIQPKSIGNSAGGQELPYNVTDMVITAASRMSGGRLTVLPFDPEYISNDFQTGGKGSRWLPGYLFSGSITEFDKDIETTASSLNLDILLGGGKTESDTGYARDNTSKMSRVAIDLQILDYKTHAVIPGLYISNTVNVMEIDKGNELGFSIYGSGIGVSGKITKGQGFHRAVRNLVEYSVLQLFGRLYNVPYWDLIGMEYPDEDVLRSIRKSFLSKSHKNQITAIQQQLAKLSMTAGVQTTGKMDEQTTHAIISFVRSSAPMISSTDLPAVYTKLREEVALSRMDSVLISKNRKARKTIASRPQTTDETTSPKKYMDQFDRTEKVFQQSIFK